MLEILTVEPLYIIAAIMVAAVILLAVKYQKGAIIEGIIWTCEIILEEVGGDLKEKDPKQYAELKELLKSMRDMVDEGAGFREILKFVTVASMQFEKVAKKYNLDIKFKSK